MQQTLVDTLELNPVATGRSRAAWAAALAQIGIELPADWRGPQPDGAAIAEGAAQGTLTRSEDDSTTQINAENGVRYIRFWSTGRGGWHRLRWCGGRWLPCSRSWGGGLSFPWSEWFSRQQGCSHGGDRRDYAHGGCVHWGSAFGACPTIHPGQQANLA
ncbi:MAG: hypothetical protein U0992_00725 [Planctomycetaceae bacterium]